VQRQTEADQQATKTTRRKATKTLPTREGFDRLVRKANEGNQGAQGLLRKVLDACPEIWQPAGDLAEHAELSLIRLIAKEEWLLTESIRRKAEHMRKELAGPNPTPLEAMAIERVVACWLQLQYVDSLCAQANGELPRAKFWLKQQGQAHRQHLSAVKSLTMIRALLPVAGEPPARPAASVPRLTDASVAPSGGNGAARDGRDGVSPVPAAKVEDHVAGDVVRCNGRRVNRVAALAKAAERVDHVPS